MELDQIAINILVRAPANAANIAAALRRHADMIHMGAAPVATASAALPAVPVKGKPGRPRKNPLPAATVAEDEFDLGDADGEEEVEAAAEEDGEFDGEEEEATTEEPAAPAPAKINFQDIVAAFAKYAKANSREDAAKILKKFGCKSVKELKPAVYPQVMATLKK